MEWESLERIKTQGVNKFDGLILVSNVFACNHYVQAHTLLLSMAIAFIHHAP